MHRNTAALHTGHDPSSPHCKRNRTTTPPRPLPFQSCHRHPNHAARVHTDVFPGHVPRDGVECMCEYGLSRVPLQLPAPRPSNLLRGTPLRSFPEQQTCATRLQFLVCACCVDLQQSGRDLYGRMRSWFHQDFTKLCLNTLGGLCSKSRLQQDECCNQPIGASGHATRPRTRRSEALAAERRSMYPISGWMTPEVAHSGGHVPILPGLGCGQNLECSASGRGSQICKFSANERPLLRTNTLNTKATSLSYP